MGSGGFTIWVSSTSFQKISICWPQQPPTEKVLEFNAIFRDSTQNFFFSKHPNKAEFNDMDNSEVLSSDFFQALEPLQPQWPQQPHFINFFIQPNGWIIPSTQITNTSPFFWNGSSKIQFFTDIWYTFCRRLLRPAYVTFLKTGWWNSNVQNSWTH